MSASPFVISRDPFAMRELMRRVALGRKKAHTIRQRRAAKRVHVARIGTETIESNLPLN